MSMASAGSPITPGRRQHPDHLPGAQTLMRFIASKGSIAVDGISLTVNEVTDESFGVNIIPITKRLRTSARSALEPPSTWKSTRWRDMLRASWEGMKREFRQVQIHDRELIEEAKHGRMFVLVDDEDRENEGD